MQKLIQCKFLTGTVCPQQDLDFAMSFCQMCCRSLTLSGLPNIFLLSKKFCKVFEWLYICFHLFLTAGMPASVPSLLVIWTSCHVDLQCRYFGKWLGFPSVCLCFQPHSNAASCWNQRWNYRQVRQVPRSWVSSQRCIWQEVSRFRPTRGWRCKDLHSWQGCHCVGVCIALNRWQFGLHWSKKWAIILRLRNWFLKIIEWPAGDFSHKVVESLSHILPSLHRPSKGMCYQICYLQVFSSQQDLSS